MSSGRRIGYGLVGLFLFVLALQVMSRSTQALVPVIRGVMEMLVTGPLSAMGSGWLFSYIFLNGASVAALAMALFSSGLLTELGAFMAVSGSRVGAAFIVVVIGVAEYLRGKNDDIRDSCSIGILTFLITYLTYLPAIALGYLVLMRMGWSPLAGSVGGIGSVMAVFDPLVGFIVGRLPPAGAFLLAIGGLFASLEVFDSAFSGMSAEGFENEYLRFVMRHHLVSFLLGAVVTLVTTSVSISIGLIVPMYNREYIKRREIIPYIMGANITTLAVTIFAGAVLETATGVNMVLLLVSTVTAVTVVYLLLYDRFESIVKALFDRTVSDLRVLGTFVGTLVLLPVVLILL
jgi:sodium-dependent phosphate cotransporter